MASFSLLCAFASQKVRIHKYPSNYHYSVFHLINIKYLPGGHLRYRELLSRLRKCVEQKLFELTFSRVLFWENTWIFISQTEMNLMVVVRFSLLQRRCATPEDPPINNNATHLSNLAFFFCYVSLQDFYSWPIRRHVQLQLSGRASNWTDFGQCLRRRSFHVVHGTARGVHPFAMWSWWSLSPTTGELLLHPVNEGNYNEIYL